MHNNAINPESQERRRFTPPLLAGYSKPLKNEPNKAIKTATPMSHLGG